MKYTTPLTIPTLLSPSPICAASPAPQETFSLSPGEQTQGAARAPQRL